MVKQLILIWIIGVASFFTLWALLTMVIKRISDRKNKENNKTEPS